MPRDEELQLSDDHIILKKVLDKHQIAVDWVALTIGRSSSQVYRYLAGEATIPSIIWRRLYERTRDEQIMRLFAGDVPVVVVDIEIKEDIYDQIDGPTLKQNIRLRREQLAVEENILEILADGKINKKDAAAIERFKQNHDKAVITACKIKQLIIAAFERSKKK